MYDTPDIKVVSGNKHFSTSLYIWVVEDLHDINFDELESALHKKNIFNAIVVTPDYFIYLDNLRADVWNKYSIATEVMFLTINSIPRTERKELINQVLCLLSMVSNINIMNFDFQIRIILSDLSVYCANADFVLSKKISKLL